MLSAKYIDELTAAEQAALPPELRLPGAVIIRESRPGEAGEPRNHILRATFGLKGKAAGRDAAKTVAKAAALLVYGSQVASSMGRWSRDGTYDPVPDLRELYRRATLLLARCRNGHSEVAEFCAAVGASIEALTGQTAPTGAAA